MGYTGNVEYYYQVADKEGRVMENATSRKEARILKKLYEVREREPFFILQGKIIKRRIR